MREDNPALEVIQLLLTSRPLTVCIVSESMRVADTMHYLLMPHVRACDKGFASRDKPPTKGRDKSPAKG